MSARAIALMKSTKPWEIDTRMPEQDWTKDSFTMLDRKELMKQGLQLDQLVREMADAKLVAREDVTKLLTSFDAHEKRIVSLELTRRDLQTQFKTTLFWMTLVAAALGSALRLFFDKVIK